MNLTERIMKNVKTLPESKNWKFSILLNIYGQELKEKKI